MKTKELLEGARRHLQSLKGEVFDVLTISQPSTGDEIRNLAKIVSKLSPMMGNLIEFKVTDYLNGQLSDAANGKWKRQDPGFPDVIFDGSVKPAPGFEIKAWFPLATEMTGRFRDSKDRFVHDEVDLVILAWLPEHLFWGKPKIVDVCIVSGKSVAKARDNHYHQPPHYLVIEPEDTTDRTSNLQQTNTSGYVLQEKSSAKLRRANEIVAAWGTTGYSTCRDYQAKLKELMGTCKYRLDTNYAKIDRIDHAGIERFKRKVLDTVVGGKPIKFWSSKIKRLPVELADRILHDGDGLSF